MKPWHRFCRALLGFIGGYHLLVGFLFLGPQPWLEWAGRAWGGVTRQPGAEVFYVVRPFGVYLLVFGVAMLMAAWNPVKNRALISLGVVLFALRIAQRLATIEATQAVLGISAARTWTMVLIVSVLGGVLLAYRLTLLRETRADAGAKGS